MLASQFAFEKEALMACIFSWAPQSVAGQLLCLVLRRGHVLGLSSRRSVSMAVWRNRGLEPRCSWQQHFPALELLGIEAVSHLTTTVMIGRLLSIPLARLCASELFGLFFQEASSSFQLRKDKLHL